MIAQPVRIEPTRHLVKANDVATSPNDAGRRESFPPYSNVSSSRRKRSFSCGRP